MYTVNKRLGAISQSNPVLNPYIEPETSTWFELAYKLYKELNIQAFLYPLGPYLNCIGFYWLLALFFQCQTVWNVWKVWFDRSSRYLTKGPPLFAISFVLSIKRDLCWQLDTDELTVENAITRDFEKIVRMHLDPVWHQLGAKTRQLVADIKTLRLVLEYVFLVQAVALFKGP